MKIKKNNFPFQNQDSLGYFGTVLKEGIRDDSNPNPYNNYFLLTCSNVKENQSLISPFTKNLNDFLRFKSQNYILFQMNLHFLTFQLNQIALCLKFENKTKDNSDIFVEVQGFNLCRWVKIYSDNSKMFQDEKIHYIHFNSSYTNQKLVAFRVVFTNLNSKRNHVCISYFDIFGKKENVSSGVINMNSKPYRGMLISENVCYDIVSRVPFNKIMNHYFDPKDQSIKKIDFFDLDSSEQIIPANVPLHIYFPFEIFFRGVHYLCENSCDVVVYSNINTILCKYNTDDTRNFMELPWAPITNHISLTFKNTSPRTFRILGFLTEYTYYEVLNDNNTINFISDPFNGFINYEKRGDKIYFNIDENNPSNGNANSDSCNFCIHSTAVDFMDNILVQYYSVFANYVPTKWILYGAAEDNKWFIIDEVANKGFISKSKNIWVAHVNNLDIYFSKFKLSMFFKKSCSLKDEEKTIRFEVFGQKKKILESPKLINSSITHIHVNNNNIGILKTLFYNNYDKYITVHSLKHSRKKETHFGYSVFENNHDFKDKYYPLDPRQKGKYVYSFHNFHIQIESIVLNTCLLKTPIEIQSFNNENKLFYILNSNQLKPSYDIEEASDSSYSTKFISNLVIDTRNISLKDFDFFGKIMITQNDRLIPNKFSCFPFFTMGQDGIIKSIENYAMCNPMNSGIFQAVGQFNTGDNSEISFTRDIVSIFDEFNETTATLTFKFKFKIKASHYVLRVPSRDLTERYRNPAKWIVQASNDDFKWVTIHEVSNTNIFTQSPVEAVSFRCLLCDDFYSMFRIIKYNSSSQFNQLVLKNVEFFGLVAPILQTPDFFWQNFPMTICPLDFSNGILGSLKYYGNEIDQFDTTFQFPRFTFNLHYIAIIDMDEEITLSALTCDSRNYQINLKDDSTEIEKINNISFIKLNQSIEGIVLIKVSYNRAGIEFFGSITNEISTPMMILPDTTFSIPFPLNYKYGIFSSLLAADYPTLRQSNTNLPTTLFKMKVNKNIRVLHLVEETINPANDSFASISEFNLDWTQPFILFDFIDTSVSISFIMISCDTLKSLFLYGSNDGKEWSLILDYFRPHGNHSVLYFNIQSKNSNSYRYFKLEKERGDRVISYLEFYGKLTLIGQRIREPCIFNLFSDSIIPYGLDYSNGILNSLNKYNIKKYKHNSFYIIDFVEVSVVLSLYTNSNKINKWKIEGLSHLTGEWIFVDEQITNNRISYPVRTVSLLDSIRIETDEEMNFDKIEFFGTIKHRNDNAPKSLPTVDILMDPLNGILKIPEVKYEKHDKMNYTVLEFLNATVCLTSTTIQFKQAGNDRILIESSNDCVKWTTLITMDLKDYDINYIIPIETKEHYKIFRFVTKTSLFENIELFGHVNIHNEIKNTYFKEIPILSFYEKTHIPYSDDSSKGIFHTIEGFFQDLSRAIDTSESVGNRESVSELLRHYTISHVDFIDNSNEIIVEFLHAKVNITHYMLEFFPFIQENATIDQWTVQYLDNEYNWIILHQMNNFSINSEIHKIEDQNNAFVFPVSNETTHEFSKLKIKFNSSVCLRKIEIFGDIIPVFDSIGFELSTFGILNSNLISLNSEPFAGILQAMLNYSNVFSQGIIQTHPIKLQTLFFNKENKNEFENVEIDEYFQFCFNDSIVSCQMYSIDTTMKSWDIEVEVDNTNENEFNQDYDTQKKKWIRVVHQKSSPNIMTYPIFGCPDFSKIRFIDTSNEKNNIIRRIDFFGKIKDRSLTNVFRYDLLNGIIAKLLNHSNQKIFSGDIFVFCSSYRINNPLQLLNRTFLNEMFIIDGNNPYITFRFCKCSIRVDNYTIIVKHASELTIEGSNDCIQWKFIDKIENIMENNESKNNQTSSQLTHKKIFYRKSNSSDYYHYIRVSSNESFALIDIEFFGDIDENQILKLNKNSLHSFTHKNEYKQYSYTGDNSIGIFSDSRQNLDGILESIGFSSSEMEPASSDLKSIFGPDSNELNAVILYKTTPFFSVDFAPNRFILTHLRINSVYDITLKIQDNMNIFEMVYHLSAGRHIIQIPSYVVSSFYKLSFLADHNPIQNRIVITEIEFFGSLLQNNESWEIDNGSLLMTGHNQIELTDHIMKGLIHKICDNSYNLDVNGILQIEERYPFYSIPVFSDKTNPKIFRECNSPQITYQFINAKFLINHYAIKGSFDRWIVEGSLDKKSWQLIDSQFNQNITDSIKLFTIQKAGNEINHQSTNMAFSYLRFTAIDALFEKLERKKSIQKIEFFGDLIISNDLVDNNDKKTNKPTKRILRSKRKIKEKRKEKDEEKMNLTLADNESQLDQLSQNIKDKLFFPSDIDEKPPIPVHFQNHDSSNNLNKYLTQFTGCEHVFHEGESLSSFSMVMQVLEEISQHIREVRSNSSSYSTYSSSWDSDSESDSETTW
ncbi:hypothetical protein TRFO_25403 [Tritrichomonas foetus]|uniref:Uncharacterized protein n=1 Tax=Tritrichomonas foetus TaxID=1144522 RepID=A0A1J4K6A5_9EUKA|nr:hypothetical protein TRFO_25403 [Tritrichomonas foetus]|eukprot:OHT06522.1 hypothetical protein TRFO_25403 [Tritrichomonas foetus]